MGWRNNLFDPQQTELQLLDKTRLCCNRYKPPAEGWTTQPIGGNQGANPSASFMPEQQANAAKAQADSTPKNAGRA